MGGGESKVNEYEKAFVDHMSKEGLAGPNFARLTKEVFEARFGGGGDALFEGSSQETLEDPKRFASELYKTFGTGALQYYVEIVRYLNSGKFRPQEEDEMEAEEEELASIVKEVESTPEHEPEAEADKPPS